MKFLQAALAVLGFTMFATPAVTEAAQSCEQNPTQPACETVALLEEIADLIIAQNGAEGLKTLVIVDSAGEQVGTGSPTSDSPTNVFVA